MQGKSNIFGMGYPVAALVNTYTEGASITYQAGFVIGTGVEAVYNVETSQNEDYGDDELQDFDNGANGISGTLELNMVSQDTLAKLLGWSNSGSSPKVYHITDDAAPFCGFGYYFRDVASGGYTARWIHRCRFSRSSHTARTKEKQIEWNHPTLDWQGTVVHLATPADKGIWNDEASFTTSAAAKAWLKTKAGISDPVVTT